MRARTGVYIQKVLALPAHLALICFNLSQPISTNTPNESTNLSIKAQFSQPFSGRHICRSRAVIYSTYTEDTRRIIAFISRDFPGK